MDFRCENNTKIPMPRPATWHTRKIRMIPEADTDGRLHYMAEGGWSLFGASDFGMVAGDGFRSEEHTSELQSLAYLVWRLLLEKKKSTPAWGRTNRTIGTDFLLRWDMDCT